MLDPNYAPGWVALAEADIMSGRVGLAQNRLRALLQEFGLEELIGVRFELS